MKASKIVVMKKVEKNSQFSEFWQGEIFYTHSKNGGVYDELNLAKLLNVKSFKTLKQYVGDFCLMPNLIK